MGNPHSLLDTLPQTQCGACGYAGCAPFAAALNEGRAAVGDCEPGGVLVRARLARALGDPAMPTRAEALAPVPVPARARIVAEDCIGCAKCLETCPVDAILGASRQLHAVLDSACTGCGLCLPPCPVDCIELAPRPPSGWVDDASPAAVAILESGHAECVDCGACVPACPERLDPAALYHRLREVAWDSGLVPDLARCTSCAQCDRVCPSRIPLARWFEQGRALASSVTRFEAAAAAAGADHARREARLATPRASTMQEPVFPALDALDVVRARQDIGAALARCGRAPGPSAGAGE